VAGVVSVSGTATAGDFSSYKVEIGKGSGGWPRTTVAETRSPVTGGQLGTWDTRHVENGVYTVVLSVFGPQGKLGESAVQVTVQN
jgi:hypothetical protein